MAATQRAEAQPLVICRRFRQRSTGEAQRMTVYHADLYDHMRPGARRLLQRVIDTQTTADIHTASQRYEPAELARLITHGGIAGIANGAALMKHRLRRYAGRGDSG